MSTESLKSRSDLTIEEFDQLLNEETDIKIYKKLNFLKLKAEGHNTKNAYKLSNLKKSIAYLTLDQWNEGGYNALLRKSGGGRKIKLNEEQLKELHINIESKKLNSEEEVQKFIKNKWDKEYTIPGIKNLLKTQFNTILNENHENINNLTTKLEKHLIQENDNKEDAELNRLKFLLSR